MSSVPASQSSGSEGTPRVGIDDRKRKRMLSNRESAKRSRMRKQQHLDELLDQAAQLREENARIAVQADLLCQQYMKLESDNDFLRAQLMELTHKLESFNSVLRFVEEFSGMAMDIPDVPDPLLKPWHLPCPAQLIMASADILQF